MRYHPTEMCLLGFLRSSGPTIATGSLIVLFAVASLVISADEASALPRMSATSGAPCTTCHYNADGGGMRSEIGWGTQWLTGAVDHDTTGLGFLDNRSTNKVLDWMAVGGDARLQVTRLGEPTIDVGDDGEPFAEAPSMAVLPMQFQPYLALLPHRTLTLQGSADLVSLLYDEGGDGICAQFYPGQTCLQGHATYSPDPKLPKMRAGFFRPSMGIRHDDHTMLIDADASRRRPTVIPPNYAELGAEVSYQPRHWIRSEVGAFYPNQLARAVGDAELTDGSLPLAVLARLTYFPRFDFGPDRSFYGWIGASVYGDVDQRFRLDQGFMGLGWLDRAALMLEVAHMEFGTDPDRRAFNTAGIFTYQFWEWLVAEARVERAATRDYTDDETHVRHAAVAGVHFYPVPFVKIRPEFRYGRTDAWHMGQYAVQLHLFY